MLLLPAGGGVTQPLLEVADLPDRSPRLHLLGGRVGDHRGFVIVVQVGEHPVVFLLLRSGSYLLRVALRTLDGQAEHALADAVHAVE
jgi:hypothetical protein